ncbi:MAG TPA: rhodanese-like domain-containing protein [Bauldia sp.]|nr:rhodanese-like domain-containing protein [Bauldia sp.]
MKTIDAGKAAKLHDGGAMLVDVREPGEFARSRIPGSRNLPLSRLASGELGLAPGQAAIFLCASGGRTTMYAAHLSQKAGNSPAYVLSGGLSAWAAAGLPVEAGGTEEGRGWGAGLLKRLWQ